MWKTSGRRLFLATAPTCCQGRAADVVCITLSFSLPDHSSSLSFCHLSPSSVDFPRYSSLLDVRHIFALKSLNLPRVSLLHKLVHSSAIAHFSTFSLQFYLLPAMQAYYQRCPARGILPTGLYCALHYRAHYSASLIFSVDAPKCPPSHRAVHAQYYVLQAASLFFRAYILVFISVRFFRPSFADYMWNSVPDTSDASSS